ncbi:MAG: Valyl-tRNA synthetase [Myxococcales bacterium]|nr:Valyl-tRNA synthetase [Myxococcales bacterium]
MSTSSALPKQYDPSEVEQRWIRFWIENGFFHADEASPTVPYSITLPPPNVTGSLHIGHALGSTMQDILIRWNRMKGSNAMWMPGTDHASIAVHVLLEKDLARREHKTRFDLGREEFLRRAWEWKQRSGNRISEQEKLMGFSLDWPRERFTMDDKSNRAVREAFVRLYEEGLIFRAKRMINWDTASETVVSDLEVDTVNENGSLWEIKYPLVDGGGESVVATTRPETMLGDTAVAVHKDDARYKHLHGKLVELPLTGRQIPIVGLEIMREGKPWPDASFGSGAVKVTPGHDPNDYEASQVANLPILQIIDPKGKICAPAPQKYIGLTVEQARKAVVADLEAGGFLGEVKPYVVPRGRSQRSGVVIEPMLMDQWWVKAAPLAAKAVTAVEQGKTKFIPEHHTKVFMHWMTNIQDWCISRQLWWGHRIPAWYCEGVGATGKCNHITVSRTEVTACEKCQGTVRQDEDILDTWFSSALWPFSTLGWPDKTRELATFYPNNVLVTGPDIIFFWVARMMMFGLHFMGKVPFRTVYLTSIVTDEHGKKMSKTKGNVLDPLDLIQGATIDKLLERVDIEKPPDPDNVKKAIKKNFGKGIEPMGTDALRFTLALKNTGSPQIKLSVDTVRDNRNFINKLWNSARFALMNLDGYDPERFEAQLATKVGRSALAMPERWILSRLQKVVAEVDTALEGFRFSEAAGAIYHFVWDELCDWYIELAKPHLHQTADLVQDPAKATMRHVVQGVLTTALETTMRLLHPFAPFVTEEIWQQLPKPPQLPGSLMITVFPRPDAIWIDASAEAEMQLVQDVVGTSRMLRATYNVPPAQSIGIELRVSAEAPRTVLTNFKSAIDLRAKVKSTIVTSGAPLPGAAKALVGSDVEIVMPLGGLIDVPTEKARIAKDIGVTEKEIGSLQGKLDNPNFIAKADKDAVADVRNRVVSEGTRLQFLKDAFEMLQTQTVESKQPKPPGADE